VATIDDPKDTRGQLIAASAVNGASVYDTGGTKLGSIYDVMLDKVSGKADYAIMSFGGFLSIGERYHPLPWNQLKFDVRLGGYVVNLDRTRLEGAPSFATDELRDWDDRRRNDIDSYYGAPVGIGPDVPGIGGGGLETRDPSQV
jgi:sporulation protein YlmC with PRC-barrel domain